MIKIFYDVETTGTKSNRHSVFQLSGLVEKDGDIVRCLDLNFEKKRKKDK